METKMPDDLRTMPDEELDKLLGDLRKNKEAVQSALRQAVAEQDRRATLRDMQKRYGAKAVQAITGAGGIASKEAVGKDKG